MKSIKKKTKKSSKIILHYSSNNSGGSWWLTDDDWKALKKAGWKVDWAKNNKDRPKSLCKDGRWLGALATKASKKFNNPDEGIKEWQEITKQDPWEKGCNCCGQPHNFSYIDNDGKTHYASIQITSSFGGWD